MRRARPPFRYHRLLDGVYKPRRRRK